MSISTKVKTPTNEFLKVVKALRDLAEQQGVDIHITVPTADTHTDVQGKLKDRKQVALGRRRADLAWLEAELRTNEAELAQLSGNYVAVHKRQIVAVSEDRKMALLGATQTLGNTIDEEDILIVPICVPSTDSEEEWLDVKRKLGIKE